MAETKNTRAGSVMVVGGGIAGVQAALDLEGIQKLADALDGC